MSEYTVTILWEREEEETFADNRYHRTHVWEFDGGTSVSASASPLHVLPPLTDPEAVDPEEAFVAALSSCHMLTFLYLAAKRGIVVDYYRDNAVGYMEKNTEGRLAITRITLRPWVVLSGEGDPGEGEIAALHHEAHEGCYLANSVKTVVTVEVA